MRYCSIDFETANQYPDSACAIGLCEFDEEGCLKDKYYSLIRPSRLIFDPRCTAVHRLDPIDISKAPTLADIWDDITAFIYGLPLVAHNANFDIPVLKASAEAAKVGGLKTRYYCTLSLSRRVLANRTSYRLKSLAEDFGWVYEAHMALDDAFVCGKLFSRLCGDALFSDSDMELFMHQVYGQDNQSGYPRRLEIEPPASVQLTLF